MKKAKTEIVLSLAYLVIVAIFGAVMVLLLPCNSMVFKSNKCFDMCKLTLVETISQNLTFPVGSPSHMDTYESWSTLLDRASSSIDIGAYYWTMRREDVVDDPSAWKGEEIFRRLMEIGKTDVDIKIVQNNNSDPSWLQDTQLLADENAAAVRTMDFTRLIGSGILHTKMWLVDDLHFYVGSANLDWRALTQVKEMGIMVSDCSCMAEDLQKVFSVYWMLGEKDAVVPNEWPSYLETDINMENPKELVIAGLNETMYISVAPPAFLPKGRSADLAAILDIIDSAQEFIYIALMDYFPLTLYLEENYYWPDIDNRLRAAAFDRGVQVRLMPSWWNYTNPSMKHYLKSLEDINPAVKGSMEVKLFEVPIVTPAQANIPYSRVNHNKYMVTEKSALIGTSNWSGDYFLFTAGVSIIVSQTKGSTPTDENIHIQLRKVFDRDWFSKYAKFVSDF